MKINVPSDQVKQRAVMVYVPEILVWTVFRSLLDRDALRLPIFPDIPPDALLENVWYEPSRRAFGFLLSHPTFVESPVCCYPPEFVAEELDLRVLAVKDGVVQVEGQAIHVERDPS